MPKSIVMNLTTTKSIPVNEPVLSEESKKNVIDALDTGWISSAGKYVTEFEEKFAHYLGVKHAITVSNGTAALHVALLALGIGPGDEVIVPAFTMAATWMTVIHTGAKPVFVDCEADTYNIDPALIEAKISNPGEGPHEAIEGHGGQGENDEGGRVRRCRAPCAAARRPARAG